MVGEISNHDSEYIMSKMPLARGYQFRTLYWIKNGYKVSSGVQKSSLNMIIP